MMTANSMRLGSMNADIPSSRSPCWNTLDSSRMVISRQAKLGMLRRASINLLSELLQMRRMASCCNCLQNSWSGILNMLNSVMFRPFSVLYGPKQSSKPLSETVNSSRNGCLLEAFAFTSETASLSLLVSFCKADSHPNDIYLTFGNDKKKLFRIFKSLSRSTVRSRLRIEIALNGLPGISSRCDDQNVSNAYQQRSTQPCSPLIRWV